MHRTSLYITTIFILASLLAGCSKSSSPTQSNNNGAPSFPSATFKGPKTQSTDQNVLVVNSYVATANVYGGYFGAFAASEGKQNGNTWTWTVTNGTESVTFSMTKQSDGSYSWQWSVNGHDQNGITYNNKVFYEGTVSADGKNGEWKIYQDTSSALAADFKWNTNASGTLSGNLITYQGNGTTVDSQISVTNKSDGSGEVDAYTGAVVVYKATWTATGSGQWWTYDNTGTQTSTGSWS